MSTIHNLASLVVPGYAAATWAPHRVREWTRWLQRSAETMLRGTGGASTSLLRSPSCWSSTTECGVLKILSSLFDRIALTGDIEFRAERHIPDPFALDDCRKLPFQVACSDSLEGMVNGAFPDTIPPNTKPLPRYAHPVRYLPATARSAFGFVRAIVRSVRAAPLGCLRPCSQPCRVRTDTPSSAAN